MITANKATGRLEEWLKTEKLPEMAEMCLRNFVMSCPDPKMDDLENFIDIDIADFSRTVRYRLVLAFAHAYYDQNQTVCRAKDNPDFYKDN
jgi:hypothetical protein